MLSSCQLPQVVDESALFASGETPTILTDLQLPLPVKRSNDAAVAPVGVTPQLKTLGESWVAAASCYALQTPRTVKASCYTWGWLLPPPAARCLEQAPKSGCMIYCNLYAAR
jgi:hypothetical protein